MVCVCVVCCVLCVVCCVLCVVCCVLCVLCVLCVVCGVWCVRFLVSIPITFFFKLFSCFIASLVFIFLDATKKMEQAERITERDRSLIV
jgi:uncharacterized membrane protein YfcA